MNPGFENTDQWLTPENLQDMAETLASCDFQMLVELRNIWPAYALNAASKLLDADTKKRIKQWVLEQNAQSSTKVIAPPPKWS